MAQMTFEEAKRLYVHRFTMEHVPAWARKVIGGWIDNDAMVWVFADSYDRTPGA